MLRGLRRLKRVERPLKELRGLSRVRLESGETRRVTFDLAAQALAYYDQERAGWQVEPGAYTVSVGPSSARLLRGIISGDDRFVEVALVGPEPTRRGVRDGHTYSPEQRESVNQDVEGV